MSVLLLSLPIPTAPVGVAVVVVPVLHEVQDEVSAADAGKAPPLELWAPAPGIRLAELLERLQMLVETIADIEQGSGDNANSGRPRQTVPSRRQNEVRLLPRHGVVGLDRLGERPRLGHEQRSQKQVALISLEPKGAVQDPLIELHESAHVDI